MWDSFFMNKDSVQSIVDEVTNCYLKYYRQEHANSSCTKRLRDKFKTKSF